MIQILTIKKPTKVSGECLICKKEYIISGYLVTSSVDVTKLCPKCRKNSSVCNLCGGIIPKQTKAYHYRGNYYCKKCYIERQKNYKHYTIKVDGKIVYNSYPRLSALDNEGEYINTEICDFDTHDVIGIYVTMPFTGKYIKFVPMGYVTLKRSDDKVGGA